MPERKRPIEIALPAAILFWEKQAFRLLKWGFKHNLYDPCTTNMIFNGKQCAICRHVGDLEIPHIYCDLVSNVVGDLNKVEY